MNSNSLYCCQWYFNCTIQELKRPNEEDIKELAEDFNCTIQELKLRLFCLLRLHAEAFQLHHTGIKTIFNPNNRNFFFLFQLHHTGIKTSCLVVLFATRSNFNCTIQELKLGDNHIGYIAYADFNCTIQELKHFSRNFKLTD